MKKVMLGLAFVVASLGVTSCKTDNAASKIKKENVAKAQQRDEKIGEGAPLLELSTSEYDFGTVKEGELVETVFKVTNKGKSDLVIIDAKVTCGCTVPTWPRKPIAPGATDEVKVKFDTRGRSSRQNKTITLITNTIKGRELFTLKGMVTPKNKK